MPKEASVFQNEDNTAQLQTCRQELFSPKQHLSIKSLRVHFEQAHVRLVLQCNVEGCHVDLDTDGEGKGGNEEGRGDGDREVNSRATHNRGEGAKKQAQRKATERI